MRHKGVIPYEKVRATHRICILDPDASSQTLAGEMTAGLRKAGFIQPGENVTNVSRDVTGVWHFSTDQRLTGDITYLTLEGGIEAVRMNLTRPGEATRTLEIDAKMNYPRNGVIDVCNMPRLRSIEEVLQASHEIPEPPPK